MNARDAARAALADFDRSGVETVLRKTPAVVVALRALLDEPVPADEREALEFVVSNTRGAITEAMVDAAARSLASLSEDEWAPIRNEDHVRYYVVSARQALEAAEAAR